MNHYCQLHHLLSLLLHHHSGVMVDACLEAGAEGSLPAPSLLNFLSHYHIRLRVFLSLSLKILNISLVTTVMISGILQKTAPLPNLLAHQGPLFPDLHPISPSIIFPTLNNGSWIPAHLIISHLILTI